MIALVPSKNEGVWVPGDPSHPLARVYESIDSAITAFRAEHDRDLLPGMTRIVSNLYVYAGDSASGSLCVTVPACSQLDAIPQLVAALGKVPIHSDLDPDSWFRDHPGYVFATRKDHGLRVIRFDPNLLKRRAARAKAKEAALIADGEAPCSLLANYACELECALGRKLPAGVVTDSSVRYENYTKSSAWGRPGVTTTEARINCKNAINTYLAAALTLRLKISLSLPPDLRPYLPGLAKNYSLHTNAMLALDRRHQRAERARKKANETVDSMNLSR